MITRPALQLMYSYIMLRTIYIWPKPDQLPMTDVFIFKYVGINKSNSNKFYLENREAKYKCAFPPCLRDRRSRTDLCVHKLQTIFYIARRGRQVNLVYVYF